MSMARLSQKYHTNVSSIHVTTFPSPERARVLGRIPAALAVFGRYVMGKGWCLLVLLKKLTLPQRASTKEDTDGEVYRDRCAFGKLYGGGCWAERQAAALRCGGHTGKDADSALEGDRRRQARLHGTQAEWLSRFSRRTSPRSW